MWSSITRKADGAKRLGLIINPIAGLGGRVGLKGSDGLAIQRQALALGAVAQAAKRAKEALEVLGEELGQVELIAPPGEMGAEVFPEMGLEVQILGEISAGGTTGEDTCRAAEAMLTSQVDLLLFAGGDGTARDIYRGIGGQMPVIGIPAGVKIHSAAFATHPRAAGELAAAFLQQRVKRLIEAEVVDLDEEAYRRGIITTRLYGFLLVPHHHRLLQKGKTPTPASENAQMEAIAWDVVENMQEDWQYILGPGTTTRAVAACLGFEKTLVGVDVVRIEELVALDVNEQQLLRLIGEGSTKIILTPIGGQGFLFGRGNQPISPQVIREIGVDRIQVICTPDKLHALLGRPLLVDTGDVELDEELHGHITITTGYRERAVYRVGA